MKTFSFTSKTQPATPPAEPKRSVLFGTGITKKKVDQKGKSFAQLLQESEKRRLEKATPIEAIEIIDKQISKQPVAEHIPIVDLKTEQQTTAQSIILDEYQTVALEGLRKQKFAVLIGAAGTGKTTVTKQLVEILEQHTPLIDLNSARASFSRKEAENREENLNVAIAFCSFTGRAVQQMKRALPPHYHPMCSTIHSLLGYAPDFEERTESINGVEYTKSVKVFRPTFTASNKLPYKVIVMDEGGMTGTRLWNELVAALTHDARIIIIGDINQLPPVMGKSVLGFAMINWPTYVLEKIHRQAEGNPIIANAHRILQGHLPVVDNKAFPAILSDAGSLGMFKKLTDTVKHLYHNNLFDPFKDAIIVPQNKGTLGQIHINEDLVHFFNKEQTVDGIVVNPRTMIKAGYLYATYAIGDKVMILNNDRDKGLTNGMIGRVTDIALNGMFNEEHTERHEPDYTEYDLGLAMSDEKEEKQAFSLTPQTVSEIIGENENAQSENQRQASHIMTVDFYIQNVDGDIEERTVEFATAGAFRKITHAYAFTCHKAQGAEYPTVVICVHSANARMLSREWLYTAVTRARERVILVHNNRGLMLAVNNQRITGKTVAEKAQQFLAMSEASGDDTTLPVLNDPVELEFGD